jgi:hypothetical protein
VLLIRENLLRVFGERDAEKRRQAMDEIWAQDGIFIDPNGPHAGRAAIDHAIAELHNKVPDFVFAEIGPTEVFHRIGRLAWGFGTPGAPPAVTGLDVVITANGRITALYTFLDPQEL